MKKALVTGVAVVISAAIAWTLGFTVVPIDEDGAEGEVFDAVAYVDDAWGRIETTIREDAVDLAGVLSAMRPDANGLAGKADLVAIAEQSGLITAGEAHVYMVKATGTVTATDTESSLGTMDLQVDGYDGPITVEVYVGPRIPSDESSVRDAVGFISFGDFREQTEYGKVSAEINKRVSAMLSSLDVANLEGVQVTVYGALTIRTFNLVEIDVSVLSIVPIAVEVT